MDTSKVIDMYNNGFQGAPFNPIEREFCFDNDIIKDAAVMQHLLRDNPGNGKRALLWRSREKYDPGAFEQEPQTDGDCVSHGDRNARDVTRCVEIHIKGEPEEYFKRGATEPTYGFRGHSGAGMDPARAARFVTQYGYLVRQDYPNCSVNLTNYRSSIGASWGRSGPPECILEECSKFPVGNYLTPNTPDEALALFYNGYACHSGQDIGFANTPNSKGYHERSGSWNHDMASVGFDDTKEIWPIRVYFVPNSWGAFNEQWSKWVNDTELQKILGPPIGGMVTVPDFIWEPYFLGGDSIYFYSDIEGFPAKTLPNYGTEEFL